MSKKPVKKSDEDKKWLPPRRDREIKSQMEYHLIICEGTETEPNYFKAMKLQIAGKNKNKISIEVIGSGRGTTKLLDEAIKKVQGSTNYISNAWLVYDKDDFTDESFNEVVERCKALNQQGGTIYNPIWSNVCIEVWVLLHFCRFENQIDRKECIKKINYNFEQNGLGKYRKNDENLYKKLEPFMENAISNAKWLESKYINTKVSEMNPCTEVYKLVELLKKYM